MLWVWNTTHQQGDNSALQALLLKSESEVALSCPTLGDPMDCSLPGSSFHNAANFHGEEMCIVSSCL